MEEEEEEKEEGEEEVVVVWMKEEMEVEEYKCDIRRGKERSKRW